VEFGPYDYWPPMMTRSAYSVLYRVESRRANVVSIAGRCRPVRQRDGLDWTQLNGADLEVKAMIHTSFSWDQTFVDADDLASTLRFNDFTVSR